MKANLAHRIVYALMACSLLFVLFTAGGCTVVKTDTITVFDFHPVGGQTQIEASKDQNSATLKATRGQGSAADLVSGVVDAATGL